MYKRQVYNPVPIYMGDKPGALPVEWEVLYFTTEEPERVRQVLDLFCSRRPFDAVSYTHLYQERKGLPSPCHAPKELYRHSRLK